MTTIQDLESQIRDFITAPRRQAHLLKNNAFWAMLCSSLDIIGDTELAIEAYLAGEKKAQESEQSAKTPQNLGDHYLILYGILQVLFVQQDAVKHLAESLAIVYTHDRMLIYLR
jgi:hypothetical protein